LSVKGKALEGAGGVEEEVVIIFKRYFSEKGGQLQEFVIILDPSILPYENEQKR
jgi:hypothetical protein